jgi:uncharacterized repeat protein (TIGR02543 family)
MRSIFEILELDKESRKTTYTADGIDKIKIDGTEFTGYGSFSFLWEKSYVKSPERSSDGTIGNLNSYATFLVPHLKINFSLMSIETYRKIMELLYSKNEFLVECYDIVHNETTINKMYFSTEEMPKLWAIARVMNNKNWVELMGVQNYTVEMIGTNSSLDTVEILYYDQNGSLIADATQEVVKGTQAIINCSFTAPAGFKFDGWWNTKSDKSGNRYKNGEAVDLIHTISLYPELSQTNQYDLSLNYGYGISPIQSDNALPISSVPILNGQKISTAISNANIQTTSGKFSFPEIGTGINDITYSLDGVEKKVAGNQVYSFSGWYWTNEANEATKVNGDTKYEYSLNRTIYQIYETIPHTLTYDTGTSEISIEPQLLGYGDYITLPKLARYGYDFKGWTLPSGNSAPTTMPPVDIKVVAKWEKQQ